MVQGRPYVAGDTPAPSVAACRQARGRRLFSALGVVVALVNPLLVPRATAAQFFDPDSRVLCWTCNSHNYHFAGGATVGAMLRVMPFVKQSWETPAGRVATVAIAGAGWEMTDYLRCRQARSCGRPDAGFGLLDLTYDIAGAAAVELLLFGLKRVPGLKRLL